MSWNYPSLSLDLEPLKLDSPFSPQGFVDNFPQPQQEIKPVAPQNLVPPSGYQTDGYNILQEKNFHEVSYVDLNTFSPGGESVYGANSSISQGYSTPSSTPRPLSRSPVQPNQRLDIDSGSDDLSSGGLLDPLMENSLLTSATNTLNNYGGYTLDSNFNSPASTVGEYNSNISSEYNTLYDNVARNNELYQWNCSTPACPSPYIEPSFDSPYCTNTSPMSTFKEEIMSSSEDSFQPNSMVSEDKSAVLTVPSGKLCKMHFLILFILFLFIIAKLYFFCDYLSFKTIF